jgi:hypothetical protein
MQARQAVVGRHCCPVRPLSGDWDEPPQPMATIATIIDILKHALLIIDILLLTTN